MKPAEDTLAPLATGKASLSLRELCLSERASLVFNRLVVLYKHNVVDVEGHISVGIA